MSGSRVALSLVRSVLGLGGPYKISNRLNCSPAGTRTSNIDTLTRDIAVTVIKHETRCSGGASSLQQVDLHTVLSEVI